MEIMFEDLIPDAQERLLKEFGVTKPEEMNWDSSPVAYVDIRDSHDPDEDDLDEDSYDRDFDFDEEEI